MAMGPVRVVKAFLPALEKAKGAKIMSVSSQLAASTWPYGGYYVYSSAKAAGNRIMQILASLQSNFNMDGVMALLFLLAGLGMVVTKGMERLERWLLRWQ